MTEILMVWGENKAKVAALCFAHSAGRNFRVLRTDDFSLSSAESTNGEAIDSHSATYRMVIEIGEGTVQRTMRP